MTIYLRNSKFKIKAWADKYLKAYNKYFNAAGAKV